MTKDEALNILERINTILRLSPKEHNALIYAIETLKKINVDRITRVLADKIPFVLDGREDFRKTLAQLVVNYLGGE
jgi:hypothetical protein